VSAPVARSERSGTPHRTVVEACRVPHHARNTGLEDRICVRGCERGETSSQGRWTLVLDGVRREHVEANSEK